MSRIRRLGLFCATLALSAIMAGPALAQKEKVTVDPARPCFVDLTKALGEYRKSSAFTKYEQKLRAQHRIFSEEMQLLAGVRYCTEDEKKEALTILAKPQKTAAENQRLEALKKKSDQLDNELAALAQKQNPTDADTKRISELNAKRTDAVRDLAKEDADRRDRLRKMESDLLTDVEQDLLKVVEKVAKEYKVPAIYNLKSVLYGGQDLTDEVIKRLPK
ncbi:MAG: OmpH family outer membrane protein [Armatimonadota bacterium]